MELDLKERLILSNQYLILEKVDPENARDYQNCQKALLAGYEHEYVRMVHHFDTNVVTEEQCREVIDILTMFRVLGTAFKDLKDKKGIDSELVVFRGFDGNEEGRYFSYASYLLEDLGLFQESKGDELNSHCPLLETYRAMLLEWQKSADKVRATREDIFRITSAPPHS